ncbi:phage nozzle protein [Acinetobacter larvae]|uniref:Carbohydrate-binding protein n=1 Tax=Acinetobacter larvae TaxID=1789224 RepID=A0A1B2LXA5_9GAMM|nr:carbohydrate-binding protein [Acinetobacter larvae]AOA57571.1 carbohydrate-binding protein [Acinetobacter larvae]
MAKISIIKNNFSSGELSPLLSTRTDVAQYAHGANQIFNAIPLVEGGVKKRPGTFYRSQFTDAIRLIPFVSTTKNAYLIILKPKQIIVYDPKSDKQLFTLNTSYEAAAIPDLQYVHSRYVMYFTHQEYKVSILECSEDFTNWQFKAMEFDVPPTDEVVSTPNVALTPSGKDVGEKISLIASNYPDWNAATTYFQDDRVVYANAIWKALRDNKNVEPKAENLEDWAITTNEEANVFKPEHVGAIVQINGGYARIVEYVEPSKVMAEVVVELTAVVQAIAKSWVLKTSAFNDALGYPKCCSYFKQRLVFANTKKFPNKLWFSRTGNPTNFLETTEDADAFSVVSSSDQSDSIAFLAPQKGLITLTSGAEFLVGSDGVLTPTSVQIDEHTAYGAYNTRPCRVGNELLFVQRGGQRLRALSYRYEVDGLVSPEISILSSHIGENHKGIKEITYQQEPQSLCWLVLGDGKAASITFNREQEVIAWARHDFGGKLLSVCALPSELGSDYCYFLIDRGSTITLEEISFNAFTDCERKVLLDAGQSTIDNTEFSFLNDIAIYQRFDDVHYSVDFSLEDNKINLKDYGTESASLNIGRPINMIVGLFPPELSEAPATSLSNKAKLTAIAFYFHKTQEPIFNNQVLQLYTFNGGFSPPKPFTGRHMYEGGDWDDLFKMELLILHNKPLPFHMQAMSMTIQINER